MMGNYIEALKDIKGLNSVTETNPKQKHIRMIPVYVGLSIIILLIAGYFFCQGDTLINLAQKKSSEAEASPVYRYPMPSDDTGEQHNLASQPSDTLDLSLPIQEDSFIKESRRSVNKEPITDKSKTVVRNETPQNIGAEKVSLLSSESTDAVINVKSSAFSTKQKDLKVLKEKAVLKESASVMIDEEVGLTERTGTAIILHAGPPEDKTKPAVPPKTNDSQLKSKKLIDKKLPGIEETGRTENEDIAIKLNQLDLNVTQLTPVSVASDKKKQTDYKLLKLYHVKNTKLNTGADNPKYQSYIVYLHYTSDENREIMEQLAVLLEKEGFDVLGIEKVDYQYRDIRYFHNKDKPGALFLQNISNRILANLMNIEEINFKIKNLSKKYTNARKGALELWVNL